MQSELEPKSYKYIYSTLIADTKKNWFVGLVFKLKSENEQRILH